MCFSIRFDFSRGLGVKLGTSIDYGEYLDIRPYTSDKSVSHVIITMTTRVSYFVLLSHRAHHCGTVCMLWWSILGSPFTQVTISVM